MQDELAGLDDSYREELRKPPAERNEGLVEGVRQLLEKEKELLEKEKEKQLLEKEKEKELLEKEKELLLSQLQQASHFRLITPRSLLSLGLPQASRSPGLASATSSQSQSFSHKYQPTAVLLWERVEGVALESAVIEFQDAADDTTARYAWAAGKEMSLFPTGFHYLDLRP